MSHVLIIGAGLSGCTSAKKLAENGVKVTLIEKEPEIGGKVRRYGCKATDKCNNCGVCLTGGLWETVEKHPLINIITSSVVSDISGTEGDFSGAVNTAEGVMYINNISSVIVSTGFVSQSTGISSHLQIDGTQNIITGTEIEEIILNRSEKGIFSNPPKKVAFIQCFGSRDKKEESFYCSRVCCSYATRAAKVIKNYDPECEVDIYYMELQAVKNDDYYKELTNLGIEFIKCRPLKIKGGNPGVIEYDDPKEGITSREYDLIVLSEGIHPTLDNHWMAETYGLGQDEHGFLKIVGGESTEGIYVAGCARTPLKIEESYSDSVAAANKVLASCAIGGGLKI